MESSSIRLWTRGASSTYTTELEVKEEEKKKRRLELSKRLCNSTRPNPARKVPFVRIYRRAPSSHVLNPFSYMLIPIRFVRLVTLLRFNAIPRNETGRLIITKNSRIALCIHYYAARSLTSLACTYRIDLSSISRCDSLLSSIVT